MKPKEPESTDWSTLDEINFIRWATRRSYDTTTRLVFLEKYREVCNKRERWKDDCGTNIEKEKIFNYIDRRIKALNSHLHKRALKNVRENI